MISWQDQTEKTKNKTFVRFIKKQRKVTTITTNIQTPDYQYIIYKTMYYFCIILVVNVVKFKNVLLDTTKILQRKHCNYLIINYL